MGSQPAQVRQIPLVITPEQPTQNIPSPEKAVQPAPERNFDWGYWDVPTRHLEQSQKLAFLKDLLLSKPKDARVIERFIERQDRDLKARKQKNDQLIKLAVQEQTKGCSFKPHEKDRKDIRPLKQFLADQTGFLMKKEEQVNQLKTRWKTQQQTKEMQDKPVICKQSAAMARKLIQRNGTSNLSLFQRLYLHKKDQKQKSPQPIPQKVVKPDRALQGHDTAHRLYNKSKQKRPISTASPAPPSATQSKSKQKSQKHLTQKIDKEFAVLINQLDLKDSLSYVQFNQLLVKMHFVSTQKQVSSEVFIRQRELASDAWLLVERGGRSSTQNSLILVYGLMRLNYHKYHKASLTTLQPLSSQRTTVMTNSCRKEQLASMVQHIGSAVSFGQEELDKLGAHFDLFLVNKLNRDKGYSQLLGHAKQKQHHKESKLREAEREFEKGLQHRERDVLASRHRDKILQEALSRSLIKSVDQFRPEQYWDVQQQLNQLKRENKLREKQKQKSLFESRQLNVSQQQKPLRSPDGSNPKRYLQLYQLAHSKSQQPLQPMQELFPHQPAINKVYRKPSKSKLLDEHRVDQHIKRIRRGNKDRVTKQTYLGRGELVEDSKVPMLFVDVNFGQSEAERLVVYEGQTAEEVARQFILQHSDLSAQSRKKLISTLRDVIRRQKEAKA